MRCVGGRVALQRSLIFTFGNLFLDYFDTVLEEDLENYFIQLMTYEFEIELQYIRIRILQQESSLLLMAVFFLRKQFILEISIKTQSQISAHKHIVLRFSKSNCANFYECWYTNNISEKTIGNIGDGQIVRRKSGFIKQQQQYISSAIVLLI